MLRSFAKILTLFAVPLLLTSCAPTVLPDARLSSEETIIRQLDEQWSAAALQNDLEKTVGFYSEDAVLLAPNAPIAKDAKSIRDSWAGLLGPNTAVSWKATKIEVAKSGELAYVYGVYQLTIKPAISDTGKIVEVWKKQADGKWKCIVDTYNSDFPLPPVK